MKTLTFLMIASLCFGQQVELPESERARAARVSLMKTDDKIAYYEKALKEHPGDAKNQAGLASAFIQKMRETTDFAFLNRASAVVEQILKADAKSYDGLRLLAEIETHRHNFPHAAELTAELVKRNPSDTGAWGLLGDSYMELGQYDDAGRAYQQMLTLTPNLTSYNRVAYHKFVTGHGEEALAWMQQAVLAGSNVPENLAWCEVEFGDMLFKTGHPTDAKTIYHRALATLPGYHKALGALGRYYASTGDDTLAIENLKQAQAVIPLPEYAAALEAAYTRTGKVAEARQQRQLLDVIDKLGQANGEKGNRALAIAYADDGVNPARAVALAQGEMPARHDVYAYDALSWALFKAGRIDEAEAASAKAMVFGTPEPLFRAHADAIAAARATNSQMVIH